MLKRAYSLLTADGTYANALQVRCSTTTQHSDAGALPRHADTRVVEDHTRCLKRRRLVYNYNSISDQIPSLPLSRGVAKAVGLHGSLGAEQNAAVVKKDSTSGAHQYEHLRESDFGKRFGGTDIGHDTSYAGSSVGCGQPSRRGHEHTFLSGSHHVGDLANLSRVPDYPREPFYSAAPFPRPSTPSIKDVSKKKPCCETYNPCCSHSGASTTVPSATWDGSQCPSSHGPSAHSTAGKTHEGVVESIVARDHTALCLPATPGASPHSRCLTGRSDETLLWPPSEVSSCVLSASRCGAAQQRKSNVRLSGFRIEGEYIITPGNHRVLINRYVTGADCSISLSRAALHPAAAALATYAHDMYSKWRLLEEQMDRRTFQLSFRPRSDLERFRQMALQCVLQYASSAGLSFSTSHCSVHNVHRVLLHYVDQKKVRLTANMFFGTLAACLRMALKHEETPELLRPFRESPDTIWRTLGFGDGASFHVNTAYVNTIEVDCLKILKDPLTPPSAADYLDRYLTVGGWPVHVIPTYRELALYLTNLALFSRTDTDQLAGIPPSLVAACALSLAIKIISAGRDDGYEFWPQRLVVYTGYALGDLRPGVRGISTLLRRKPSGSDVLHRFHPAWARYSWR